MTLDISNATADTFGFIRWRELVCPVHGNFRKAVTGFLGDESSYITDDECPGCRDERIHAEMLESYRQEEWERRYESVGIPKRFNGYSLESFQCATSVQSCAVAACKEWGRCNFTNLLICGQPDTGKTHLLCAALREAVMSGRSARFILEDDLFRSVKETYSGKQSAMTETQVLEYFGDIDFLAIDDMGRSRWSADESAILMKIINRRYNNRKFTAISTNLPPRNIDANGRVMVGIDGYLGEAIYRRLEPDQRIVMATWPAYREK